MQNCELVDVLTQPDWVIAIARVTIEARSTDPVADDAIANDALTINCAAADPLLQGYRCWVFTPDFTVLDDGEVHPSREAAAESARRLVIDSRDF